MPGTHQHEGEDDHHHHEDTGIQCPDMLDYEINKTKLQKLRHSSASCYIDEIESFVFGGSTSRFWMLRKHILTDFENHKKMPFFSWECITLQLKGRDINLVFKNE